MVGSKSIVIHWFRLDLRAHDNLALNNAINEAETHQYHIISIYFLELYLKEKIRPNSLRFLNQSLQNLDLNLRKLTTRLYILRGKAEIVLSKLFKKWHVKYLSLQVDIDPELINQYEIVDRLAEKENIFVVKSLQHTVYDVHSIIKKNNGSIPLTYWKFLSLVNDIEVKEAIEITKQLSDSTKSFDIQNKDYDVPSPAEFGFDIETFRCCKYPGGKTEALKRLNTQVLKKECICKFEKPNISPNSIEPSTTVLSAYLSRGCLSSKLFYHKLREIEFSAQHTSSPISLLGQLMWREFYYTEGAGTKNFEKFVGNPTCTQIPWGKNNEHSKTWAEGGTGYPIVDATMRQLKQESWIHHLARHMIACFLTRGDLWISWEEGAKVFEDLLLDYDWSLNVGNWMWLSASAFFYKYFRVYSPVIFGKKTDKNSLYIKKYVPELKKYLQISHWYGFSQSQCVHIMLTANLIKQFVTNITSIWFTRTYS